MIPLLLVPLLAAPIVAIVLSRRDHQMMATAIGPLEVSTRVRADRELRGAAVRTQAVWPLLRIEATRLARHPAPYLFGLPLFLIAISNFQWPSVTFFFRSDVSAAIAIVPYAWGTLIASNLLTLRSRRWRSDELLATTPVPARSRTLAHLLATLALVPGAVVLLIVWYLAGVASGRAFGTPRLEVLAVGPLLVVGAGCVGVAVARWLPHPLFGWVAVIATVFLQVNLGQLDPRWRWLHFSMHANEDINYPDLAPAHHGTHLAYLVGGILLVAAIALARDGLDARAGSLGVVAIVVLVVAGVAQTTAVATTVAESYAQRLENPAASQRCESHDRYQLCADPALAELVPRWAPVVDGVLGRVPVEAMRGNLVVRQRPMIDAKLELHDEIAERVDPAVAWPDDDEVSVNHFWSLAAPEGDNEPGRVELSLAYRVASASVGLPPDAWWSQSIRGDASWTRIPHAKNVGAVDSEQMVPVESPLIQCTAYKQARTIAALWLAGQSTPAARAELQRLAGLIVGLEQYDKAIVLDAVGSYRELFPPVLAEQGSVATGSDVVAAAALLKRDDAEVARVLHTHWRDLVDRDEPAAAAELLTWFGLDSRSTRTAVEPLASSGHEEDEIVQPAVSAPCPSRRSTRQP